MTDYAHALTALVDVPAAAAFAFLIDPAALSRWSLGCMDLVDVGGGVYTGRSLFDGGQGWLSIEAVPLRLLVDYHVGTLERRVPRISARVLPGAVCDLGEGACYVTLTAWRPATMSDERWRRLCATHETEIWLIKAQMESARR
ncbi:MAG: SRPBCC family protein [Hyphomicrobiales bacterium]|nr:SRPBCC family protein [Hyphomicrobiales bacterium]